MSCDIEYTDDFGEWFDGLNPGVQDAVAAKVGLLEVVGVDLDYPHSSGIQTSRYTDEHLATLRAEGALK